MCGLFGFSRTTPLTNAMTPALAIYMDARGDDSWGVTDGDFIFKDNTSILNTWADLGLEAPTYHTRGASVGAVSVRNAHPFRVESDTTGKVVVGVHNGCITNHGALKTKYARHEIEVDSEHIFHHLADDIDLGDLAGWGNVVWYEYPQGRPEQRVRYFSRFNTIDLVFAKMKSGEVVFASTENAISVAAQLAGGTVKFFYKTEPRKRYSINNKDQVMVHEEMRWGLDVPVVPVATTSSWPPFDGRGRVHNTNHDLREICAMRGCTKVITDDELVCKDCLKAMQLIYVG